MRIADVLWKFIEIITKAFHEIHPYTLKTLFILTVINIAWLGIKTIFGKYELADLIEQFLVIGISVYVVKNLEPWTNLMKESLFKITGMSTDVLQDPALILAYAQTNILNPISQTINKQFNNAGGIFAKAELFFSEFGFFLCYGIAVIAVYICFAVVVVQIVIAYISYWITLLFGQILLPFSTFRPLEFIGKNVFTAILTQTLTLAVIVFVAQLGLGVFQTVITGPALDSLADRGKLNIGTLWVILACVLIYFYLCLKAPTLVSTLVSGSPSLGAGGLFSTVAAVGHAVSHALKPDPHPGGGSAPAPSAGQGSQSPAASVTAATGPNQFMPKTASSSSGSSVNTVSGGGGQAQTASGSGQSAFTPSPGTQSAPATSSGTA